MVYNFRFIQILISITVILNELFIIYSNHITQNKSFNRNNILLSVT